MKYLVGPNNRFNTLNDVCMPQYNCSGIYCQPLDSCPEKCTTRCDTRCKTYCGRLGCQCKTSRDEINSTGSFI